jgi:cation:H+ antiporter
MSIGLLIITLFVILFGAEAFTNALEHLGERLKISEGVTGSIFAAVGTALPETMVPIVAASSGRSAADCNAT